MSFKLDQGDYQERESDHPREKKCRLQKCEESVDFKKITKESVIDLVGAN